MKKIFATMFLSLAAVASFAGDAAVFSEIGFSEDGRTYIFGQYGKTDKKYEAWAEIYTVDVAKNDFVKNEVYKIGPEPETAAFSGKNAYEKLIERTKVQTNRYNCSPSSAKNVLYVRETETKRPTDEIVFKDFESSVPGNDVFYHITLVPTYNGSGKTVRSRFYIKLEKRDSFGSPLLSKNVGSPLFERAGISNYRIDRIFTDESKKSIVFIIEKTVQDDTGTSIRYMVETVRL